MAKDVEPLQKMCAKCLRIKDMKEFYPSNSPYLPYHKMAYCKECSKEMSRAIFESHPSFEKNTREMCVVFQMPYMKEIEELMHEQVTKGVKERDVDFAYQYLKILKEQGVDDAHWKDLSTATYIGLDLLKVAKPTSDGDVETLQALEKEWGRQDSIYDYMFLEERYNEYSNGEDLSPSMRNTMKYLCLTELDIKKIKAGKTDNDTSKLEDKVQKYYKTLGLDKFQFKENKSEGQRTLEYFINLEEQTHPLEVAGEMFKEDITGLKKEYKEMMRCIRNAKDGEKIFPEDYGI